MIDLRDSALRTCGAFLCGEQIHIHSLTAAGYNLCLVWSSIDVVLVRLCCMVHKCPQEGVTNTHAVEARLAMNLDVPVCTTENRPLLHTKNMFNSLQQVFILLMQVG